MAGSDTSARRPPPRLGGGRFVVCAPLGDGGTAGVYLTWDMERRGWVALKAMLAAHLRDKEMRGRFKAEAETMARLSHPHIPQLYAHNIDASPPWLAMELARCGSAMSWVKANGPMPPGLAIDVLVQMCDALGYAHQNGIVHRDVKPHNFLIDDGGSFKLTDFGIARVDDNTSMTATGSQIGTFSFMAPEQRSNTKAVDERADIYALGASLYTMLTARTSAELFIAEDEDELLAPVPEQFRPVIIRACAYRREDRYPTIFDMQGELLSALARLPSSAFEHAPLADAKPLPAGPPDLLPEGMAFDDLTSALALDLDNPTWVPSQAAREAQDRTASGTPTPVPVYTMSRPSPMGAASEIPSYLDPAEQRKEALRAADLQAARAVAEQVAAAQVDDDEEESRWLEWVLYGAGGAVLVVVLFLMLSAGWVRLGRMSTDSAADRFTAVLANESAVVYELGGDRRFEDLYATYADATGAARIAAGVGFADELERAAEKKRAALDPVAQERVDRVLAARDAYADAFGTWQRRSSAFPGSVAVSIGIVSGP